MASALLIAIAVYGAFGLCFGVVVIARGLARFDSAAAHAPWTARLLWLPGLTALWPLMVAKVRSSHGARP